jgi:hypothetical protein
VAALFPLRAAHDCRPLAAKGGTGGNGGTFTVPENFDLVKILTWFVTL